MHKKTILRLAALVAIIMSLPAGVQALSLSQFTTTSKLASGKWVKISVPTDGVYELTAEELTAMGFSDIGRVAVYGQGGYMLSEVLDGSAPDDLKPVATLLRDGKLYFYGHGPVSMSPVSRGTTLGYAFQRTINAYSQRGYYFLTEEDSPLRVANASKNVPNTITSPLLTSMGYWYHEREMISPGQTGKDLLGEDLLLRPAELTFELPLLASDTIVVGVRAASASTEASYIMSNITIGGETKPVVFGIADSKLFSISGLLWYYDIAMPYAQVKLGQLAETGTLSVRIDPALSTSPTLARLDHSIITYKRNNKFASETEGQFTMWFNGLKSSDVIGLPESDEDVLVWDVANAQTPVNQKTVLRDGTLYFASPRSAATAQMIAFQPSREQLKIDGFETVVNQNLHGMEVPDMLIVCNSNFMDQAKRVAQLHREHDGMKVAVVTQEQVFNEFSSGTPDATAVRLLCKMLYDRNSNVFKNLLMFGEGTFDNRGIVQSKPNALITYESSVSKDELTSYPCDDYFGFMDDNSGASPDQCLLRLGVGRYSSSSVQEAKTDVDKLVRYVTSPDYGVWRNNFLLMADEGTITGTNGDIGLHSSQAEGINNLIAGHNAFMHDNKAYVEMFPRDPTETWVSDVKRRTCLDGRRHIIEALNAGQYFMTYVGHAGGSVMTSHSKLWRSSDVNSNKYTHLPIMTTACCNIARYDSNSRGIAEVMFHQPEGGAIALLSSAREVQAKYNDELNRAFVSAMFTTDANGNYPTLGECYMKAKQSFGRVSEPNKMSFWLMGDPAIKVNYPRPLFNISSINGEGVNSGSIDIAPMQRMQIEADVMTRDGQSVDASFSGNATATLYGPKTYYTSYNVKINGWVEKVDLYQERPLLAQVEGEVVNGHFSGSITVPRYAQAEGPLQLVLYAHKAGTEDMVNGGFNNLVLGDYDEALAETDTQAPVIETMFLNDEASFADNVTVQADAMLYVTATDDVGINMQQNTPGQSMKLILDGNKTVYNTVKDYAVSSDQGRKVSVAFPLSGMSYGHHTLAYTVCDVMGNSTTQSIDFIVGLDNAITLGVEEVPAVNQATFNVLSSSLNSVPNVNLKVTDAQGHLVWATTTRNFPAVWDMKDLIGERVPAGLYKFFGTYQVGSNYGGTAIENLIIVNPLSNQ